MNDKSTVLIVDDEPVNIKLLSAILPEEEYAILKAYNGNEALEMVWRESPDLILLDVMMPGINGYEVIKKLKGDSKTSDIPIILVTALDGMDEKVYGLEAGADEFLNKPVNRAELLARVKSLLRLKEYQDRLKARTQHQDAFTTHIGEERLVLNGTETPVVLLVEDNQKDARLLEANLMGQPYRLRQVDDGETAISLAQQTKVDLVLLDLMLPNMDGFEVCRRLKECESTQNIQIVVITNLRDLHSKIKGIELGADDFLIKPINSYELRVRISALLKKKRYIDRIHENYETAVHYAITDRLTGLYNRAYFEHFLGLEIKRSLRQGTPAALVMIDIDDFKEYNDNLGHLAGDDILKALGELIKTSIREIDFAARYGGEEFILLLPNTDTKGAFRNAERIRKAILDHSFKPELSLPMKHLTVSMGVASCPADAKEVEALIMKADQALYRSKHAGKNMVCDHHAVCYALDEKTSKRARAK
jgi:two-component system cell cycle response regulator